MEAASIVLRRLTPNERSPLRDLLALNTPTSVVHRLSKDRGLRREWDGFTKFGPGKASPKLFLGREMSSLLTGRYGSFE